MVRQSYVQPKNPALHAILSFIVAGLGTMVAGRGGRGVMILCTVFFLGALCFIPFVGWLVVPVWLGAWILNIIDGYRSATLWNQRHGIIS